MISNIIKLSNCSSHDFSTSQWLQNCIVDDDDELSKGLFNCLDDYVDVLFKGLIK